MEKSLIFCGFLCAGKTTIGRLCAEKFMLPFYDTDCMMEAASGKCVQAIWRDMGKEAFRDLETQQILSLRRKSAIVALGGGALMREENRHHLKTLGISIYLKATFSSLFLRILKRGFPAYLDSECPFENLREIACQRFPIYEKHCHYMIETDNLTEQRVFETIWEVIASDRFFGSLPGVSRMERQ